MRKINLFWAGIVGTITVSLGIVGGSFTSFAHADTTGPTPSATITVIGHSEQQVQPDTALIDAGVMSNAKDASDAQRANATTVNHIIQLLTKAGIATTDIHTTWYSIEPNLGSSDKGNQPQMNGFQAVTSFQVMIHNLPNVGNIVDILVESGANQINNVQYQISNAQEKKEKAYDAALADAKTQATTIAQSLGLSITGIQSVDTTNQGNLDSMLGLANTNGGHGQNLLPGAENLSTNVSVVYTTATTNGQ